MLGITGLRHEQEEAAAEALEGKAKKHEEQPFSVACSDPASEKETVKKLFEAMAEARKKTGSPADASFASFQNFVQKKTEQLRRQYGCHSVQYTVELSDGQVRLKAKAKV
jgi:hypothetical protein